MLARCESICEDIERLASALSWVPDLASGLRACKSRRIYTRLTSLMPPSLPTVEDESADVQPVLPERFGPLLLASALAGLAITFNRGAYAEPAALCVVTGLLV